MAEVFDYDNIFDEIKQNVEKGLKKKLSDIDYEKIIKESLKHFNLSMDDIDWDSKSFQLALGRGLYDALNGTKKQLKADLGDFDIGSYMRMDSKKLLSNIQKSYSDMRKVLKEEGKEAAQEFQEEFFQSMTVAMSRKIKVPEAARNAWEAWSDAYDDMVNELNVNLGGKDSAEYKIGSDLNAKYTQQAQKLQTLRIALQDQINDYKESVEIAKDVVATLKQSLPRGTSAEQIHNILTDALNNHSTQRAITEPIVNNITEGTDSYLPKLKQTGEKINNAIKEGMQESLDDDMDAYLAQMDAKIASSLDLSAKEPATDMSDMGEEVVESVKKSKKAVKELKQEMKEVVTPQVENQIVAQSEEQTKNLQKMTSAEKEMVAVHEEITESTQEVNNLQEETEAIQKESKALETLADKFEYLKKIKAESKFMEDAEEKRIDMEEKAWDVGGNHPKSEADSQKKIQKYEELCEHIEQATYALDEFNETYEKVVVSLKNGEQVEILDAADLDNIKLAKQSIKDIQFVLQGEDVTASINEKTTAFDELSKAEIEMGNQGEIATEKIKEGLQEVQEQAEKVSDTLQQVGDKLTMTGYHGTARKWQGDTFDLDQTRTAQMGSGMYFVDSPEKLEGFLKRPGSGDIKKTELSLEKCFILTEDYISSLEDINKILGTTFDKTTKAEDVISAIRNFSTSNKENSLSFRQSMLDLGYQGMYVGDNLANKKINDELVVYDESLLQNLETINKTDFQTLLGNVENVTKAEVEMGEQGNVATEKIKEGLQEVQKEAEKTNAVIEEQKQKIVELEGQVDDLRSSLKAQGDELAHANEEYSNMMDELGRANDREDMISDELQQQRQITEELRAQNEEHQKTIDAMHEEMEDDQRFYTFVDEELGRQKELNDTLEASVEAERQARKEAEGRASFYEDMSNIAAREKARAKERADQEFEAREEAEKTLKETERQTQALQEQNEALREQNNVLAQNLEITKQTVKVYREQLDGIQLLQQTLGQPVTIKGEMQQLNKQSEAATEQIKNGLIKIQEEAKNTQKGIHYITDEFGNAIVFYRGLRNSMGQGLVSDRFNGATFWTDSFDLAKEYSEWTKVETAKLEMINPLEIEGNGANWNAIEYLGNWADEASKKIHEAKEQLEDVGRLFKSWIGTYDIQDLTTEYGLSEFQRLISERFSSSDLPSQVLEDAQKNLKIVEKANETYRQISDDVSNVYGKHNTQEFVELAQKNGFDGVIFKNIVDSASGVVRDMSNVVVQFDEAKIHFLEALSAKDHLNERDIQAILHRYGSNVYRLNTLNQSGHTKIGSYDSDDEKKDRENQIAFYEKILPLLSQYRERLLDIDNAEIDISTIQVPIEEKERVVKALIRDLTDLQTTLSEMSSSDISDINDVIHRQLELDDDFLIADVRRYMLDDVQDKTSIIKDLADALYENYYKERVSINSIVQQMRRQKKIEIGKEIYAQYAEDMSRVVTTATQNEQQLINQNVKNNEILASDALKDSIVGVTKAVNDKTDAFKTEGSVVQDVVGDEVNVVGQLKGAVDDVKAVNKAKQTKKTKQAKDENAANVKQAVQYYNRLIKNERQFQSLAAKRGIGIELSKTESKTLSNLQEQRETENEILSIVRERTKELEKARTTYEETRLLAQQEAQVLLGKELRTSITNVRDKLQSKIDSGRYSPESVGVVQQSLDALSQKNYFDETNTQKLKEYLDTLKGIDTQFEKIGNETKLTKLLGDVSSTLADNTKMSKDLRGQFDSLNASLQEALNTGASQEQVRALTNRFLELKNEMIKTGQTGRSFFGMIKNDISQASARMIAQYMSFQDFIRYIRAAASAVTDLNSALNQLRIVSGESEASVNRVGREAYELANNLGMSTTEVVSSITEWRRLGKTIDESMILAEQAARLSTGGMMDISSATTALVSSMQAFEMKAEDINKVVDQYIYLGK